MTEMLSDKDQSPKVSSLTAGSIIYGCMAILLGAIWLGIRDFVELWHPLPESIQNPAPFALICGIAMLIGGTSIATGKYTRLLALLPAITLAIFTWRWLTRIALLPLVPGTWSGFGELLVPIAAAALIFFRGRTRESSALTVARISIGLSAIAFGLAHFGALEQTAQSVPEWIPGGGRFWAAATGIADVVGGIAVVVNFRAILASYLLAAMYFVFELAIWLPRIPENPLGPVILSGNAVTTMIAASVVILAESLRARSTLSRPSKTAMPSAAEW